MLTRIHVNQHVIKANAKTGAQEPPLSVKRNGKTHRASEVRIEGLATVVYSPETPLDCGARVWIETRGKVEWK